jgi:hypothetical protein
LIPVEENVQNHSIILVPDLSLVDNSEDFGTAIVKRYYKETGSIIHILDPKELLRLVHGAQMAVHSDKRLTLLMAFHYFLTERAKIAVKNGYADFDFLIITK